MNDETNIIWNKMTIIENRLDDIEEYLSEVIHNAMYKDEEATVDYEKKYLDCIERNKELNKEEVLDNE